MIEPLKTYSPKGTPPVDHAEPCSCGGRVVTVRDPDARALRPRMDMTYCVACGHIYSRWSRR